MMRLLQVELALRMHFVERKGYPDSLTELTPDCMVMLPTDPYSGEAFIYRRTADGYELRSVEPVVRRGLDGEY